MIFLKYYFWGYFIYNLTCCYCYGQNSIQLRVTLAQNSCISHYQNQGLNHLKSPKFGWNTTVGVFQKIGSLAYWESGIGVNNLRFALENDSLVAQKMGYPFLKGAFAASRNELSFFAGLGICAAIFPKWQLQAGTGIYLGRLLSHDAAFTSIGFGRKDAVKELQIPDKSTFVLISSYLSASFSYTYQPRHTIEFNAGYRLPMFPTYQLFGSDNLFIHVITVGLGYRWQLYPK